MSTPKAPNRPSNRHEINSVSEIPAVATITGIMHSINPKVYELLLHDPSAEPVSLTTLNYKRGKRKFKISIYPDACFCERIKASLAE